MNNLQSELVQFGLSENQAIVYLFLMEHGALRIQEITDLTNVPRSSVYEAIKGLLSHGIAEEIVEQNHKKIRAYSIGMMRHSLNDKITSLQKITKELDELERRINLPTVTTNSPLRYYTGKTGARQLLWNSLKATDTVYVYSSWGRSLYVGKTYYEGFVQESKSRNITEQVMVDNKPELIETIFQQKSATISRTPIESIRTLDLTINGETLIYNNIYAQVYLKDQIITGFEIENEQFVASQRSIFKKLWVNATPIK